MLVQSRRMNLAAVSICLAGTDVVNQHDENVRRVLWQMVHGRARTIDRLLHCPTGNAAGWFGRERQDLLCANRQRERRAKGYGWQPVEKFRARWGISSSCVSESSRSSGLIETDFLKVSPRYQETYCTRFTGGGVHVPSRIEGGVSWARRSASPERICLLVPAASSPPCPCPVIPPEDKGPQSRPG